MLKMSYQYILTMIILQITSIYTMPLQIPLLQAIHQHQSQRVAMQQQLLELQQLEDLQKLNTIHSPSTLFLPPPLLVLLPNPPIKDMNESNEIYKNELLLDPFGNGDLKHSSDKGYINEDLNSVIIDAEADNEAADPQRTLLLVPNARFSIGGIISTIPFLPFEINVPDTIAWAYNGIINWISGITRPQMTMGGKRTPETSVKMFLKQLQNKKQMMPIFVLPLDMRMLRRQL